MSRTVLAKTREAVRILGFAGVFALSALVINVLVVALFVGAFGYSDGGRVDNAWPGIEALSDELIVEGGSYRISDETSTALERSERWAMLIDADGDISWSDALPADIPTHYEMADVSSFTRWYLNDYPVTTWIRDDGILVVGAPKGSVWKYAFNTSMNSIVLTLALALALLVSNMVVAILIARAYARRAWAERDHARREWIAAVSHDVRTPLAVALADADTLAHDESLGAEQRARAERVEGKVSEVASLVADLNVANQLSYAMEPLDAAPVALAPIIRSVAVEAMNDDVDGSHPIEVALDEEAEHCHVKGDAALLRRMLSNLVGNSIRHNPQGCTVTISLSKFPHHFLRKDRCLLVVEDDGKGLEADMLEVLRRAPSDDLPEHGLGLVIVRRIAMACRGTIRFLKATGGGTRCEITFPLA
jgi:signal transduction histidine kinase